MRFFFLFIIIVAFALTIFVFGNMMRCSSKPVAKCQGLCYEKDVSCSGTSEFCETKKACRSPHASEYIAILDQFFKELKYKL